MTTKTLPTKTNALKNVEAKPGPVKAAILAPKADARKAIESSAIPVKVFPAAPAQSTKPAAPKAEAKPKKVVVKMDAMRGAEPGAKLEWLVKTNPKRAGSASHTRAAGYWNAATVGEYLAKGGTKLDLCWDADHGHVKLA